VKFEQMLEKAMDSKGEIDAEGIEPELYRPRETPVKRNGNDVELEAEIGELVKNSLREKAFFRLLNKKYQQIEAAIGVRE
jgi:flagellar basal body rod protein FlgB